MAWQHSITQDIQVFTCLIVGCAAAATILLTFSSTTSAGHFIRVNTRLQDATQTTPFLRINRLSGNLNARPQMPLQQLSNGATSFPEVHGTAKAPLLMAATGVLFLAIAAVLHFVSRAGSRPRSYGCESLAMMATTGEDNASSSIAEGPSLSRRGMGPLLTGVLLSPALAAQAVAPKAAPAAAAADVVVDAAAASAVIPKAWIKENLPGSLKGKEFVRLTADILNRQGMSPENTVACVGVCRDELCQPIVDDIESEWGDAFNMSSLGGMLTLGKTGLQAAMAHSPVDDKGRERYFFVAFPHISVDTNGVGVCTRPGRPSTSHACGALYAFTKELQGGKASGEYDTIDPEYSFMKKALLELIPAGDKPDLLDVTKTAAEASLQQIEQLIAATVDTKKADYAVCIGVLVHEQDLRGRSAKVVGPARQYVDQVWPTAFYTVVNGRKKDLIWRLEID